MKRPSRREFLRKTAEASGGLALAAPLQALARAGGLDPEAGYGPLERRADENTGAAPLALPRGFRYWSIGAAGSTMSDGRPTPPSHDGTAAFASGLSRAPGAQSRTARHRSRLRTGRDGLRPRGPGRHHDPRLRPRPSGAPGVLREPLRHQHELRGRTHSLGVLAHLRGDVPRNAFRGPRPAARLRLRGPERGDERGPGHARCGRSAASSTRRWRWTRRRASSTRPRMPRPPASSASCRRAVSRPADCRCWRRADAERRARAGSRPSGEELTASWVDVDEPDPDEGRARPATARDSRRERRSSVAWKARGGARSTARSTSPPPMEATRRRARCGPIGPRPVRAP